MPALATEESYRKYISPEGVLGYVKRFVSYKLIFCVWVWLIRTQKPCQKSLGMVCQDKEAYFVREVRLVKEKMICHEQHPFKKQYTLQMSCCGQFLFQEYILLRQVCCFVGGACFLTASLFCLCSTFLYSQLLLQVEYVFLQPFPIAGRVCFPPATWSTRGVRFPTDRFFCKQIVLLQAPNLLLRAVCFIKSVSFLVVFGNLYFKKCMFCYGQFIQ